MAVTPQNDQTVRQAVIDYLITSLPELTIHDGVPDSIPAYLPNSRDSYWVVPMPRLGDTPGYYLGATRYLFISKQTGRVVSDQRLGE
jgi:hypothetical protein